MHHGFGQHCFLPAKKYKLWRLMLMQNKSEHVDILISYFRSQISFSMQIRSIIPLKSTIKIELTSKIFPFKNSLPKIGRVLSIKVQVSKEISQLKLYVCRLTVFKRVN
jgi:hypothetical protein